MRLLIFEGSTWEKYEELRRENKILHKSLCTLIKEMLRNDPAKGTGKPEALIGSLSGYWSRRISQKDRVIYKYTDDSVHIFAIGGHYDFRG